VLLRIRKKGGDSPYFSPKGGPLFPYSVLIPDTGKGRTSSSEKKNLVTAQEGHHYGRDCGPFQDPDISGRRRVGELRAQCPRVER